MHFDKNTYLHFEENIKIWLNISNIFCLKKLKKVLFWPASKIQKICKN